MRFSDFQSETATLKKMDTDGFGDPVELDSFEVEIDPDFGIERFNNDEGEEITGRKTTITSDTLQDDFDPSHYNWDLNYKGKTYHIEQFFPRHDLSGNNNLEFVEVILT